MRGDRVDPFYEQLLLGPGLILAHALCALVLFVAVQRPIEALMAPIFAKDQSHWWLHLLLPVYVSFLAVAAPEL